MPFPLIVDDVTDSGGAYVVAGGGWGVSLGGYLNHLAFRAQTTGAGTGTASFTFSGLNPGTPYDLSLTWVELANRGTDVSWTLFNSNGTTVLASGTINQQLAPSGFTYGSRPWQFITGNHAPSGTTLKFRLDNHGADSTKFIIADAAYLDLTVVAPSVATIDVSAGPATFAGSFAASASAATITATAGPATFDGGMFSANLPGLSVAIGTTAGPATFGGTFVSLAVLGLDPGLWLMYGKGITIGGGITSFQSTARRVGVDPYRSTAEPI